MQRFVAREQMAQPRDLAQHLGSRLSGEIDHDA
jgi:hypothetical protein